MDPALLAGPAALAIAASALVVFLLRRLFADIDRREARDAATIISLTKTVAEFPGALGELTAEVVDNAKRERARRRGEPADDA